MICRTILNGGVIFFVRRFAGASIRKIKRRYFKNGPFIAGADLQIQPFFG